MLVPMNTKSVFWALKPLFHMTGFPFRHLIVPCRLWGTEHLLHEYSVTSNTSGNTACVRRKIRTNERRPGHMARYASVTVWEALIPHRARSVDVLSRKAIVGGKCKPQSWQRKAEWEVATDALPRPISGQSHSIRYCWLLIGTLPNEAPASLGTRY